MSECSDWADQLVEAQATRHAVLTGARVIRTRLGEKEIQKEAIDMKALVSYIADLQRKVDGCNGVRTSRRGIFNVIPVDGNS